MSQDNRCGCKELGLCDTCYEMSKEKLPMGKVNVRNRLKSWHEFALMLLVTTEECHIEGCIFFRI